MAQSGRYMSHQLGGCQNQGVIKAHEVSATRAAPQHVLTCRCFIAERARLFAYAKPRATLKMPARRLHPGARRRLVGAGITREYSTGGRAVNVTNRVATGFGFY